MGDESDIRGGLRDALNVFILVVLVVAQPVLTILGSNTLFFLVRRSDSLEVLLFLLVLCILLPAAVAGLCLLVFRLNPVAGRLSAALLVGACAGLFVAPVLKNIEMLSGWQQLNANIFLGALAVLLYALWPLLRTYITYMLPAVLIVPLFFWFNPGLQQTLDASDPESTAQEVGQPHSVVLVVLDSLPLSSLLTRERDIDAQRFPNFAALANASTWYRNATTVNEVTWWSVPSLLTGREVYGDVPLPTHSVYPRNLFTALGNDYDFHVSEYISNFCPPDICRVDRINRSQRLAKLRGLLQDSLILYQHSVYPEQLAVSLPRIGETLGGFADGNVASDSSAGTVPDSPAATVDQFIDSLSAGDRPQVYFLHALIPHAPWRYTPSGKEYGAGYFAQIHGLHGVVKQWREDDWAISVAYQRHLMQVAYADWQIGRLIERLEAQSLYEDTLLIVVSDHGNSYRAGQYHRRATVDTLPDFMGVPLFIKYPGQTQGLADDRNASIVDVLPTIFDQLQTTTDWPLEGFSLLSSDFPQRQGKRMRNHNQQVFEAQTDYYTGSTTVAEKYALLATGKGVGDPFAISLVPELNGVGVSALEQRDSADVFLVHRPEQFQRVDTDSGYVPVFLSGQAPQVPVNTRLAVALNGVVVTVTKVFSDAPARRRFAAMLPESHFREGANELSIFRVEQREGKWTLFRSQVKAIEK